MVMAVIHARAVLMFTGVMHEHAATRLVCNNIMDFLPQ